MRTHPSHQGNISHFMRAGLSCLLIVLPLPNTGSVWWKINFQPWQPFFCEKVDSGFRWTVPVGTLVTARSSEKLENGSSFGKPWCAVLTRETSVMRAWSALASCLPMARSFWWLSAMLKCHCLWAALPGHSKTGWNIITLQFVVLSYSPWESYPSVFLAKCMVQAGRDWSCLELYLHSWQINVWT